MRTMGGFCSVPKPDVLLTSTTALPLNIVPNLSG